MNIHTLIDQAKDAERKAEEWVAKQKAEMVEELHSQAVDFIERLKDGTEECTVKPMEVTGDRPDTLVVWIEITVPGLMPFFVCSGKKGLLLTSWGPGRRTPGALAWGQVSALTSDPDQVAAFFYEMKKREEAEAEHRAKKRKQEEVVERERDINSILNRMNRSYMSADFITDISEMNLMMDRLIYLAPERKEDWRDLIAEWSEALVQRDEWLERKAKEEAERQAVKARYEASKARYEAEYRAYIEQTRDRMAKNNDAANLLRRVHGDATLTLVDVVYSVPDPNGDHEWSETTDTCLYYGEEDQFFHVIEPGGRIRKWAYTNVVKTSAPYQVKVSDMGNRAGIVYLSDYGVDEPVRVSPLLNVERTRREIYRAMLQLPDIEPDPAPLLYFDAQEIKAKVIGEFEW